MVSAALPPGAPGLRSFFPVEAAQWRRKKSGDRKLLSSAPVCPCLATRLVGVKAPRALRINIWNVDEYVGKKPSRVYVIRGTDATFRGGTCFRCSAAGSPGRPAAVSTKSRGRAHAKRRRTPYGGYAAFADDAEKREVSRAYTFAAVRRSVTASVFSQVNSGSSRPKCP